MQADKKKVENLLKTARGQIDGIINMIDEDRYCIDIANQLMAVEAIISKANKEVLSAHLKHCIKDSQSDSELDKRVDELINILSKVMR